MGLGERRKGPSIKYVTLFLANFDPLLPLSHFAILPWTPPKKCVTHLGLPRLLVGLVQENPDKSPLYIFSLNCSRVFLFCQRVFCLEGFVRGGFYPFPLLSKNICYNRKLNITFNFMFHMYDNKMCKCDATCSLRPIPPSKTVTPSRTPSPSSVTYFVDGLHKLPQRGMGRSSSRQRILELLICGLFRQYI